MRHTLLILTLLTTLSTKAQWTLQSTHITADLRGIDNVGHGVAWASGSDGTILRTLDAGEHWQLCAKPPNGEHLDFRAIQAFDNSTAIIMSAGKGDLSRLYKTTDGCQSWKLLFTNPDKDGFFDALWMHPTGYGILLGDPVNGRFAVFETADGGKSWKRDSRSSLLIGEKPIAAFAASNSLFTQTKSGYMRGFVTGGIGGAFLFQAFNGRNWSRIPIPVASGNESSGVFSIGFRLGMPRCTDCMHPSNEFMVAVGGDYLKPNESTGTAAYSVDGGWTWTASTTPPHGYRGAVDYDAPTRSGHATWITVGPNGTDISTDDGRNWRALKPDPAFNDPPDADQHWNALSLPYAVGPHGRIATLRPSSLTSHN